MAPRSQPSSFVTGAASGIGLALARALAARGHSVTLADRDAAALTRATEALSAATGWTPMPRCWTSPTATRCGWPSSAARPATATSTSCSTTRASASAASCATCSPTTGAASWR
ncbi:MAG: SDR family NAD(P)-dependent oxidoreductase [Sandaracinaceae bacterium]|nr:SDR family NAD(P)-dependent oxidoreductase [Sandaracinaceae bacterium]